MRPENGPVQRLELLRLVDRARVVHLCRVKVVLLWASKHEFTPSREQSRSYSVCKAIWRRCAGQRRAAEVRTGAWEEGSPVWSPSLWRVALTAASASRAMRSAFWVEARLSSLTALVVVSAMLTVVLGIAGPHVSMNATYLISCLIPSTSLSPVFPSWVRPILVLIRVTAYASVLPLARGIVWRWRACEQRALVNA